MGILLLIAIVITTVSIYILLLVNRKRKKVFSESYALMGAIALSILGGPLLTAGVVSWLRINFPSNISDSVLVVIVFASIFLGYWTAYRLANKK